MTVSPSWPTVTATVAAMATEPSMEATSVPVVDLIRPAALAAHAEGPKRSIDPMRRSRAPFGFVLLAVGLAGMIGAATAIPVEERAEGLGGVRPDGRSITLTLPIDTQARLQPGQPVRFETGGRRVEGRVTSFGVSTSESVAAVAVVRATLEVEGDRLPSGAKGPASVTLTSQHLWELISPVQLFRGVRRG